MSRQPDESAEAWRRRVDREVDDAEATLDRFDAAVNHFEVQPGQEIPVITEEHGQASDRLDALREEQEAATEAWLRER